MVHASIAVSPVGLATGNTLMKKTILFFVTLAALSCAAFAQAQEAPMRGVGLLALNASDAQGLGSTSANHSALVETPDSGGGSAGIRNARGAGDAGISAHAVRDEGEAAHAIPDALPPAAVHRGDPTTPAAATPKRPSYRWQSLVPGAIK
jgi:hypothetical protein